MSATGLPSTFWSLDCQVTVSASTRVMVVVELTLCPDWRVELVFTVQVSSGFPGPDTISKAAIWLKAPGADLLGCRIPADPLGSVIQTLPFTSTARIEMMKLPSGDISKIAWATCPSDAGSTHSPGSIQGLRRWSLCVGGTYGALARLKAATCRPSASTLV